MKGNKGKRGRVRRENYWRKSEGKRGKEVWQMSRRITEKKGKGSGKIDDKSGEIQYLELGEFGRNKESGSRGNKEK